MNSQFDQNAAQDSVAKFAGGYVSQFAFTPQEVKHLEETVNRAPFVNKNDVLWERAFKAYNSYQKRRDADAKELQMTCQPCYLRVITFIRREYGS